MAIPPAESLDRIEAALSRLEAAAARPIDPRHQALRDRTRAALAELDAVIARTAAR